MNLWERVVFNRILDWSLDNPGVNAARRRALASARGAIVELGTGTGLSLGSYPPAVTRVTTVALEPALDPRAVRRAADAGVEVSHVQGDGARLPLADGQFDTAVCAFVLCTIPDPVACLRELARVLRPDGRLLFLEHIIAPPGAGRIAQRAAEPLTRRINCGCSLLRDTRGNLLRAGFRLQSIEELQLMSMPPLYRRVIRGVATPRS